MRFLWVATRNILDDVLIFGEQEKLCNYLNETRLFEDKIVFDNK